MARPQCREREGYEEGGKGLTLNQNDQANHLQDLNACIATLSDKCKRAQAQQLNTRKLNSEPQIVQFGKDFLTRFLPSTITRF